MNITLYALYNKEKNAYFAKDGYNTIDVSDMWLTPQRAAAMVVVESFAKMGFIYTIAEVEINIFN